MSLSTGAHPARNFRAGFFALVLAFAAVRAYASEIAAGTVLLVSPRASDGFLNVRRKPAANSEIAGKLRVGDQVKATGRREANGPTEWLQIQSSAASGWVNSQYLDPKKSPAAPAVAGYVSDTLDEEGTHWQLAGSTLVLTIEDDTWTFRYLEPRPGMVEEGVRRGTVLFKGSADDDRIVGTAYRFSRRCGLLPYTVEGEFSPSGTIVLTGTGASGTDRACRVTRTVEYTLEFEPMFEIPSN